MQGTWWGGGRNAPYQLDKGYCGTVSLPVDHVFCRLLFNLKLARMFEFFCNALKNLSERFGQPNTENIVSN